MIGGNLSEWAIRHRTIIVFFMLVFLGAGFSAYQNLGREEDPDFAIDTMTILTLWPGATTTDTMEQVTDRLEKKLQETPHLDYIKSYTKPGSSLIYINVLGSTPADQLPDIWYQVRKKVSDVAGTLPAGVKGPSFNDEFGDVYGIIYAMTYDGFTPREARDFAEQARKEFLAGSDQVGKISIFGTQDEKIYLEFQTQRLAELGISLNEVLQAIKAQNAIAPAGIVNTAHENILIDVTGAIADEQSLAAMRLYIDGQFYPLGNLATIRRGYADPPSTMFSVNGRPAIGIGLSMAPGGNNLTFGAEISAVAEQLRDRFPVGIEIELVSDQPTVVSNAIGGFTEALLEAIAIVLAVSFVSLGFRAGLVVALSIPLVLSIVFLVMEMMDISLQRISLGALIIALGLLVDDAMITVEMMVAKIEEGFEKAKAATFAYTSTAFPMLTGTLVTVAGFLPVGFAQSSVGQYCYSLFVVIATALVASWFVAVLFAPVIGMAILPAAIKPKEGHGGHGSVPEGRMVSAFTRLLSGAMRFKWLTITATLGLFALAVFGMQHVQRQFFPASDRPELLVTVELPVNASIFATQAETGRIEKLLQADEDIAGYSSYVGGGAVRFYLAMDPELANDFVAQFVVVGKDLAARDRIAAKLNAAFEADFPDVIARVSKLELGPPVGWPVQYRVSAETPDEARLLAEKVATVMRASPTTRLVNFDWSERFKQLRVVINQDKARQLGLTSQAIAEAFNTVLNGSVATQVRDSIYLIDVVARADKAERADLDTLRNLGVSLPDKRSVPLRLFADIDYVLDEGYIWRRDRFPTITVQADTAPGIEAPTAFAALRAQIDALRAELPPGARITDGGVVEKSTISNASIMAEAPLMILAMVGVLMFQLQSFSRLFLVISAAPLGLIGVVAAMLPTGTPMGFVATLGIIALAGMIIRNSVILIDQVEHNRRDGHDGWKSVVEAAQHRLRPILLTASAAILGMIPIMSDVFWGPMAYVVIGGLAGATLLTLVFVPALYVAWFGVKETKAA
jgi:multidrug efflux pump subunit AcrB